MTTAIDMGTDAAGAVATLDLAELLATRLLVQGNSGSGKSHLLRRLMEESAPFVQQVVLDPEGDFVTLADRYGHTVIEAADYSEQEMADLAARVRAHRVSVVLNLEGLEVDGQLKCAAAFLGRLFDAPREHWYPVLVVVDEAQLFAPAAAGEVGEEARRTSLAAMTNLMCRGRKRGLAGVIATQRLAKLAKNVAAEASNFLMGRTFLDIDMARAADLLGMERRQAEQIRDLERGQFLSLGPALARRPRLIRIGRVETGGRGAAPALAPLPTLSGEDARSLLFARAAEPPPPPPPPPARTPVEALIPVEDAPLPVAPDQAPAPPAPDVTAAVLADIVADPDTAWRPAAALYQDFAVRCRMRGAVKPPLDATGFARRLAMARAGLLDEGEADWAPAMAAAAGLPDDMLGVFLAIARAARDGAPCPTDGDLARIYGTHSLGRVKRLIGYMEAQGFTAIRIDLRKRRSIGIPALGLSTAPEAEPGEALPAAIGSLL